MRFYDELAIDYLKREVTVNGNAVSLSKKEFEIVELLSMNAGQVFDRERLKQMSLKKAFFCLTILFLLIALIFSIFSILGISKILQQYGSSIEIKIDGNNAIIPPATITDRAFPLWYHILGILQFALPIIFVTAGLLSADLVFYRIKLKKPLTELQAGAERIMQNNLDFSIQSVSKDELGQLCNAFEEMRLELLKNNRELWQQMEERKRLNAAFSHDLRNPVQV